MGDITRRAWMEMAVAGAAAGITGKSKAAAPSPSDSLHVLSQAKGMMGFGSCVNAGMLTNPDYRDILVRECNILVPENDLKWTALRPNPDDFNFGRADMLVSWAERNGMKMRGHNLLWPRIGRNPKWLDDYDFGSRPATEAERLLREHITTVCRRYGTRIFSWDVVNEAVNPRTGKVRDEMAIGKYLGGAMIDIAFDAAHQAAPGAQLAYNDFVKWSADDAVQREGVLELLARLKSSHAPIQLLGVESHIGTVGAGNNDNVMGTQTFDAREQASWKSFLDSVVAMGYRLAITEFDVSEIGTPADIPTRDRGMADLTRRYLDAMLRYPELEYVMCWGLVDRFSWLQSRAPRADGLPKRPAPYDGDYQPKLIRQAMADAFRAAPMRG